MRFAGLAAALGLLAGCQVPPRTPAPAAPVPPSSTEAEAAPAAPPPAPAVAPAGPAAQQQAQKAAMAAAEQYELGNEDAARGELRRALGLDAQNRLAQNLLRQLSVDPVATLGHESFAYTVRPGETLSRIAGRFLNDLYAFVILARYNGIAVPKQVAAGQVLKIPGRPRPGVVPPPVAAPPAVATAPGRRDAPVGAAEAERPVLPAAVPAPIPAPIPAPTPAPTVPAPATPPRPAPPPPEPTPGEKAMRAAQAAERAGDLAAARLDYLAAANLGQPGAAARAEQATRALAQRHGVAARGALARQDLDGSIAAWQRVLDIEPANGTARSEIERMRGLKAKLGSVK